MTNEVIRLIDANALHKEVTSFDHSVIYKDWVQSAIASAPTISDVAPVVHGQWIPTQYPFMAECEDCSECGYRTVYGHGFKFCPSCGAKMDLEEKS